MKVTLTSVLLGLLFGVAAANDSNAPNPLREVRSLIQKLIDNVAKDGHGEDDAYRKFTRWCRDQSQELAFEAASLTREKDRLDAKQAEISSDIEVAKSSVEESVAVLTKSKLELKKASALRKLENNQFEESQRQLTSTIDALDRASNVLERAIASTNPAAVFAQINTTSMTTLMQTLSVVVNAAGFEEADKQRLVQLVQAQEDGEDILSNDGKQPRGPGQSTEGIADLLEDLKSKAEKMLDDSRVDETVAFHKFELLEGSLQEGIRAAGKDLADQKDAKSAGDEKKAAAESELQTVSRELTKTNEKLEKTRAECLSTAQDHDNSVKAREEEQKTLKEALQILKKATLGAEKQQYEDSFLQTRSRTHLHMSAKLEAKYEVGEQVMEMVQRLSRRHHSAALNQLASRIQAVLRYGDSMHGRDPLKKVKSLIKELLTKLQRQSDAAQTEHIFCSREINKTASRKEELQDEYDDVKSSVEQLTSQQAEIAAEKKELYVAVAELKKLDKEMAETRQEQNAKFKLYKADVTEGLEAVRRAIHMLRDYYGAEAALVQQNTNEKAYMQQPSDFDDTGAGSSIIGVLEVIESDLANGLSKAEAEETDAREEYIQMDAANNEEFARKQEDLRFLEISQARNDRKLSTKVQDKSGLDSELSAVKDYDEKLEQRCLLKETAEERLKQRAEEIQGLKEALEDLSRESYFLQRRKQGKREHHYASYVGL